MAVMPLFSTGRQRSSATVNINLIPRDPFFDTALGKALGWALSVGRYIVIFTELVVIISFAARFSLDRQLTDLNDAINQKDNVISSYGELENTIRLAQYKIDQYQQIREQTNLSEVFPALSQITPSGIKMSELIIRPNNIIMGGRALSQASLNTLITNLQLSPQFHTISVEKIEIGDAREPGFDFRVRANTREIKPVEPVAPTRSSSKTE